MKKIKIVPDDGADTWCIHVTVKLEKDAPTGKPLRLHLTMNEMQELAKELAVVIEDENPYTNT